MLAAAVSTTSANATRSARCPASSSDARVAQLDRIESELATLSAQLDAATHRQLTLIREYDALEGWAETGALSCAHWLSWRVGLALGAAREKVRVARALAALPHIDARSRRAASATRRSAR